MQTPSIGRVVHYHAVKGTKPDGSLNVITLAADVTKVHDDYTVDLLVKDSSERVFEDASGGTKPLHFVKWATTYGYQNGWSWPPFVKSTADVAKIAADVTGVREPEKTEPETEGAKVVEGATVEGAGAPSTQSA